MSRRQKSPIARKELPFSVHAPFYLFILVFQLEIDQGNLNPAVTYTLVTECTDAAATQTTTVTQTMTVEAGQRLWFTNSGRMYRL